jgi:hypothetical protein
MAIPSSRSAETKESARVYKGEADSRSLITWLNETRNRTACSRVMRLIELFQIAAEKGQQLQSAKLAGESSLRNLLDLTRDAERIQRDINRILKGHRSYPHAWVSEFGIRPARAVVSRQKDSSDRMWPQNEFAAVEAVLHLVSLKLIWKVKQCRCGRWFFRRFKHVRFHDPKCRQQEHRSSSEYKMKRNEHARNLYRLHKSGKVK